MPEDQVSFSEVMLSQQGVNKLVDLRDFLSVNEASDFVQREAAKWEQKAATNFMVPLVLAQLEHNIFYNEKLTQKFLESELNNILPTRNMVEKGELIILKGNIVDDEKYAKLYSLREAFEGAYAGKANWLYVLFGQLLQVGLLFSLLYIFLRQFRSQLMEDISKLTFILVNILFMVAMVRVVVDFGVEYIWLIPFPILPITLRSFFDTRLALFVHTIAILLCGFLVPNSFVFIYLQFVAGVFSIVLVNNLYKRSQLFFTAAKIILVYCLAYLSVAIIQEGTWDNINYLNFAFFAGNGFLTFMSFPLI
ncbi:MAG: hypothetical protein U5L96_10925 [Owenweeksia sp.]|nr:hypothetical protein [Owenweeksia sp.]